MEEGDFLSVLSLVLLFEQLRVEAVPGAVLGAVPGAVLVPDGGFGAQPLVHTRKNNMKDFLGWGGAVVPKAVRVPDGGFGAHQSRFPHFVRTDGAAFLDDSHRYWRRNGGGDGNLEEVAASRANIQAHLQVLCRGTR